MFAGSPAYSQVVLFDSGGFEPGVGYVVGNLNGQNGWSVVNPPGQFSVQNTLVQSGTQAVIAHDGQTNWIFPTINYTPLPTELIRLQAGLARTLGPANNSFAYDIDVYNTLSMRTTRFGLTFSGSAIVPFVTSRYLSGSFNPAGPVTNVIVGGPFQASTFVSFDARLNYVTKSYRLLINNVDIGSDIPFADLTAADLAHADWHVESTLGGADDGYLDNYVVSTMAVPEPTSLTLLGLFGVAFGLGRKSLGRQAASKRAC